jgi:hypothetical protein
MEIILDNDQKPRGIYLPIEELEVLKGGVNQTSILYKLMDDLSHPDIFDMNDEAFSSYLQPAASAVVDGALNNGLYVSYPAGEKFPGTFIHQYKSGRKVLVSIDQSTGKEHFVRDF